MMIDVPSDAPNFTFTVANESPSRLLTWPEASLPATAVTGRIKASTRRARPWAAPVGRVVLVARARMDLDERAPAVRCHADFGVPPSPEDAD